MFAGTDSSPALSFQSVIWVWLHQMPRSLAWPAMGHWGTSPSAFNYLIFQVTSELHKLWHSTLCGFMSNKNIQTHSFVTVYYMNFIIFFSITYKLFSLSFVALLTPNAGNDSGLDAASERQ